MKFARHLAVVCGVVALVVAFGVVWSRSGAASLVADDRGGRPPAAAPIGPTGSPQAGRFDHGPQGWSITDVSDLVQTLVVEGAIVAVVVAVDKVRRRRRPIIRRA